MSFAHYCEEPSQSFSWLKHLFLTHVQLKCLPPITWSSLSSLGCLWQPPRLTCSSVSICVKKNSCVSGRGRRFFWWLLPGMYVILGLMSTVKEKEKETKQKNEVGKEK